MVLKKIGFLVFLIVCLLIINNLVHSIFTLWQKKDLIVNAQHELQKQKKEHEQLKQKLQVVNKQQFIEEEARNKLFLGKSGEKIILIPTQQPQASASGKAQSIDIRPNWKKWWDVFFTTAP